MFILVMQEPADTQEGGAPKKGTTKPPRVKKEYDLPGQTRDTPLEVRLAGWLAGSIA